MLDIYQTKSEYGCTWLKIYHQNIKEAENSHIYETKFSLAQGKFSILGILNDDFKINNKFEFLLEYPDDQGMNRWMQSTNPLEEQLKSGQNAEGFDAVSLSWPNAVTSKGIKVPFTGLGLCDDQAFSLLDGTSLGTYAYFSIGLYGKYHVNYIPGYSDSNYEVVLWVRINNIYQSSFCTKKSNVVLCFMPFIT